MKSEIDVLRRGIIDYGRILNRVGQTDTGRIKTPRASMGRAGERVSLPIDMGFWELSKLLVGIGPHFKQF